MLGQIAHAFEGDGQTHGGDHDAQIGGHGVLLGQQFHALVDDAFLQRVEFGVAVDDGLGGFDVGFEQRLAGAADGFAHALCHVVKVVGDGLHLFVENNAHWFVQPFMSCCVSCCVRYCVQPCTSLFAVPPADER